MKAYNENWIYNRELVGQAERWHRQRLLSDEQLATIRRYYPVDFRQTNGFIEIGLFLFTTVAILGCYLLPASMFSVFTTDSTSYALFTIASGMVVGLTGRVLINRRFLYRNGVDNAFVVTLAGFLAFGLNQLLPSELSIATHCLCTLPLLLVVLWYYGDTLIAFFALATFYGFVFDGLLSMGWGKDALPFVMMVLSGGLYSLARNPGWILGQSLLKRAYYADPINLTQWIALIVLAAGGNYFVVRELNEILLRSAMDQGIGAEAPPIALPWLFWCLTVAIPAIYLWQGLVRKERILIILGMLGLIAAVMTVYTYTNLAPLKVALTLGGLCLIGLATAGIRFIHHVGNGFTDAPDDDSPDQFFLNAETLTIIQAATMPPHSSGKGIKFGRGEFGGAGSEGKY